MSRLRVAAVVTQVERCLVHIIVERKSPCFARMGIEGFYRRPTQYLRARFLTPSREARIPTETWNGNWKRKARVE